eukprot:CFRG6654T1
MIKLKAYNPEQDIKDIESQVSANPHLMNEALISKADSICNPQKNGGNQGMHGSLIMNKQLKTKQSMLLSLITAFNQTTPEEWVVKTERSRTHVFGLCSLLAAGIALRETTEERRDLESFFQRHEKLIDYEGFFQDVSTVIRLLDQLSDLCISVRTVSTIKYANEIFDKIFASARQYEEDPANIDQFKNCTPWTASEDARECLERQYEFLRDEMRTVRDDATAQEKQDAILINEILVKGLYHITDHIICGYRKRNQYDPRGNTQWILPFIYHGFRKEAIELAEIHSHNETILYYYLADLDENLKTMSRQEAVTHMRNTVLKRYSVDFADFVFRRMYDTRKSDILLHASGNKIADGIDVALTQYLANNDKDHLQWLHLTYLNKYSEASIELDRLSKAEDVSNDRKTIMLQLSIMNSWMDDDESTDKKKSIRGDSYLHLMCIQLQTMMSPYCDCGNIPRTLSELIMDFLPRVLESQQSNICNSDDDRMVLQDIFLYMFRLIQHPASDMNVFPISNQGVLMSEVEVLTWIWVQIFEFDLELFEVLPALKSDKTKVEEILRANPMVMRLATSPENVTLAKFGIGLQSIYDCSTIIKPRHFPAVETVIGVVLDEQQSEMDL